MTLSVKRPVFIILILGQLGSIGGFSILWTFPINPFNFVSDFLSSSFTQIGETCYGELGCLKNSEEWFHLVYRPINLWPQTRDQINTRFFFHSRKNRLNDEPIEITTNDTTSSSHHILLQSGYDPAKPTKIIVHGFIDMTSNLWVTDLAAALLEAGDFNIFLVDWRQGSFTLYPQAAANTRLVALEIVHLINSIENQFNSSIAPNCHCIGHSLGSHVCGYVGKGVGGFGRISGLDPADPLFQYMPAIVRLSPDDAQFVDVIHTDKRSILALGYGLAEPCGHLDFYPNDGMVQPGCDFWDKPINVLQTRSLDEARRELFACDHHRAIYYFIESILSKCQFLAYLCSDYGSFLRGDCKSCGVNGTKCAVMGFHADRYQMRNNSDNKLTFYLATANAPPFCGRNYKINIVLAQNQSTGGDVVVYGKIKMDVIGTRAFITNYNLTQQDNGILRLETGKKLTFVLRASIELGNILEVRLDWTNFENDSKNLTTLSCPSPCPSASDDNGLHVQKIQVRDLDATDDDEGMEISGSVMATRKTWTLCGIQKSALNYTTIPTNSFAIFRRSQCNKNNQAL